MHLWDESGRRTSCGWAGAGVLLTVALARLPDPPREIWPRLEAARFVVQGIAGGHWLVGLVGIASPSRYWSSQSSVQTAHS